MRIMKGADPEVFMKKGNTFISAYGMIEGDKENPFPVENGAVQVDGMALEFNINPVDSEEEWLGNIESVMNQLKAMVPEFEVVATPVAPFGFDYINSQPDKAIELGCDPDFNAWEDGKVNEAPDFKLPFRTGAGHIHVGFCEDEDINSPSHMSACISFVKQLDFYLGLPSLFFDKDEQRREMYGKAGCFRPKSYGVEYRVLSNAWLSSVELQKWAYRAVDAAVDNMLKGNRLYQKYENCEHIINTSDKEAALEIIKAEGIEVPHA